MSDEQRMVTEFHRAFSIAIGTSPSMPDAATCALRMRLIQQEFDELQEAFAQQDVVTVAKELADLLYIVYGTAVSCGVEMAPVFREVHRSNMTKVGVSQRADGTWVRPAGYTPPRLQPILAAQGPSEYQGAAGHTQQRNGDVVSPTTVQAGTMGPAATGTLQAERVPLPPPAGDGPPHIMHVEPMSLSQDSWRAGGTREGDTRRRMSLSVPCPRCGKSFVWRSHRKGLKERLLSLIYVYPFRCQVCANRFRAFQFRARYAKRALDQRQYVRLSTQLPTSFAEMVKPGEQRVGQGMVTEISLGGCYLHTAVQLLEGTLVSLELQTEPNTRAIAVEAAIVRIVRSTGVGLEFLRLSEPEQGRLSQFIRQLLPEQLVLEHEAEGR